MFTVVHLITQLELGGAQENTLLTAEGLDRSRFRVILGFGPGGMLDPRAEAIPDIELWRLPWLVRQPSPSQDSYGLWALRQRLRQAFVEHLKQGYPPEGFILHTHSSKAGVLGRLAGGLAHLPLIIHGIHGFGFFSGQSPAKRALFLNAERLASRSTHAFFSVSRANAAEAQALGILRASQPMFIVRSGMALSPFEAAQDPRTHAALNARLRRELKLPKGPILLSVANFKPQKDPLTLIEAFAKALEKRGDLSLALAGDGPLQAAAKARAEALQITNKLRFLGWRRDIPELIGGADLVCLASRFEGLPRVAVQALAAGRVFVGTRVDGSAEVVKNGQNGFLVEPEDPSALAKALLSGLQLQPKATDLSAWRVEHMVKTQEAHYEALSALARSRLP